MEENQKIYEIIFNINSLCMASNANFGKGYAIAIQFYSVISYKMHMVFRLTLKYSLKFYLLLMTF